MDLDSNTVFLSPHDKQPEFSSESIMSFTMCQTEWRFPYFNESISAGKAKAGTIYGGYKGYPCTLHLRMVLIVHPILAQQGGPHRVPDS